METEVVEKSNVFNLKSAKTKSWFKDSILLGISSQYLMIYKDFITQNTNHLIFNVFMC